MKFAPKHVMLHIPKTCGSLVGHLGDVRSIGHRFFNHDIYGVEKWTYNKEAPLDYCTPLHCFTIVRNPFTLLASYYHHNNYQKDEHSGWANCNKIHGFKTFEEFVKAYCDPDFKWHAPLFKQSIFSPMYDETGVCIPEKIIFAEDLIEGLVSIGVNRPTWTPNLRDYTDVYNDELQELIEKKCSHELRVFGYNFEGRTIDDLVIEPDPDYTYDIITNTHRYKGVDLPNA